jgi:hypothetical protein
LTEVNGLASKLLDKHDKSTMKSKETGTGTALHGALRGTGKQQLDASRLKKQDIPDLVLRCNTTVVPL